MSLQNHMKDRVVTKNMYSRTFFMFRHSQTYLNFKMVKAEDKYQEFALLIFIDSCWTCVLGMFWMHKRCGHVLSLHAHHAQLQPQEATCNI